MESNAHKAVEILYRFTEIFMELFLRKRKALECLTEDDKLFTEQVLQNLLKHNVLPICQKFYWITFTKIAEILSYVCISLFYNFLWEATIFYQSRN